MEPPEEVPLAGRSPAGRAACWYCESDDLLDLGSYPGEWVVCRRCGATLEDRR